MYLTVLTLLLFTLVAYALISPSVWQGLALLLIVFLMAFHSHNQPPLR